MKSDSIIYLADTFSKALKWIEEVTGEPVKGRLLETEKIAHNAKNAYIESAEVDKDGVHYTELKEEFFNTVGDIRWLVDTYEGLHRCPISNSLKDQLTTIQGGPLYPKDESIAGSTGRPRNIHFELVLSSILTLPKNFTGDCQIPTAASESGHLDSFRNIRNQIKGKLIQFKESI